MLLYAAVTDIYTHSYKHAHAHTHTRTCTHIHTQTNTQNVMVIMSCFIHNVILCIFTGVIDHTSTSNAECLSVCYMYYDLLFSLPPLWLVGIRPISCKGVVCVV